MEHMAWKGRIKPGCKEEYKHRHDAIWPEMVEVLKRRASATTASFMSTMNFSATMSVKKVLLMPKRSRLRARLLTAGMTT